MARVDRKTTYLPASIDNYVKTALMDAVDQVGFKRLFIAMENYVIDTMMIRSKGSKPEAAKRLQMGRTSLIERLVARGIMKRRWDIDFERAQSQDQKTKT